MNLGDGLFCKLTFILDTYPFKLSLVDPLKLLYDIDSFSIIILNFLLLLLKYLLPLFLLCSSHYDRALVLLLRDLLYDLIYINVLFSNDVICTIVSQYLNSFLLSWSLYNLSLFLCILFPLEYPLSFSHLLFNHGVLLGLCLWNKLCWSLPFSLVNELLNFLLFFFLSTTSLLFLWNRVVLCIGEAIFIWDLWVSKTCTWTW